MTSTEDVRRQIDEWGAGLTDDERTFYRQVCDSQVARITAAGPEEWWAYPAGVILPLLEQQVADLGVRPEVLAAVTAMFVVWVQAGAGHSPAALN